MSTLSTAQDYFVGYCMKGIKTLLQDEVEKYPEKYFMPHAPAGVHLACANGHLKTAKWLCSKYNIVPLNKSMDSACANGHLEMAKWLNQTFGIVPKMSTAVKMCKVAMNYANARGPSVRFPEGFVEVLKWVKGSYTMRDLHLFHSLVPGVHFDGVTNHEKKVYGRATTIVTEFLK